MHSVVSHSNIELRASSESISRNFIIKAVCVLSVCVCASVLVLVCMCVCACVQVSKMDFWSIMWWEVGDDSTASKSYCCLVALTLFVKHGRFQMADFSPSQHQRARSFPFIHVPFSFVHNLFVYLFHMSTTIVVWHETLTLNDVFWYL